MMGYSELGAEPKSRLKRPLCVVLFAEPTAPTLPTAGPKPAEERNSELPTTIMVKQEGELKSFILVSRVVSSGRRQ